MFFAISDKQKSFDVFQFSATQPSLPSNQSYGQKIACGEDGTMSQLSQVVRFKTFQLILQ